MGITYIIVLFVFGAIFGSLWWVLLSRKWDKEWIKSIFFGRSKCVNCDKTLWFFELIPFVSFFLQKWKCRSCGHKMTNFYWIIELLSWCLFVLTYLFFPQNNLWELWFWIFINWWFLLLLIFDIQKYEIHIPLWIFTTILSLVFSILYLDIVVLVESVLIYVWVFFLIYIFSKYYMRIRFKKKEEGFWQWDILLSFTIWALSWFVFHYNSINFGIINLIDVILIYVVLSCLIWLIYALISRFFVDRNKQQIIPFLPSMIISFWLLLLFGKIFIGILQ